PVGEGGNARFCRILLFPLPEGFLPQSERVKAPLSHNNRTDKQNRAKFSPILYCITYSLKSPTLERQFHNIFFVQYQQTCATLFGLFIQIIQLVSKAVEKNPKVIYNISKGLRAGAQFG
ncbi:MAG: hypothetical protein K2O14_06125, partial [Oscillospiraceae bacterium]|nr:hypothetical protein [Oscillospiraceae bacterium]